MRDCYNTAPDRGAPVCGEFVAWFGKVEALDPKPRDRREDDMRSLRRWIVICSAAAIPAALLLVLGSSAATLTGSAKPAELAAVDTLTASNAWAVGDFFPAPSDYGDFKTTTEHFHGTGWSKVSSPSPSSYTAQLAGVAALSTSNVWAVGQYNARSGNDFTLIEHWTASGWKIVASPNPGTFGNALTG